MMMWGLIWVSLVWAEDVNILRGDWEVIPILENLPAGASYYPEYIDDFPEEHQSTTDLFIFSPDQEVAW